MQQITFGKPVAGQSQHVAATAAAGQRITIPDGVTRIQLYCDSDIYIQASSSPTVQASVTTDMRLPGGMAYSLDLIEVERYLGYICPTGVSGQLDMTPLA